MGAPNVLIVAQAGRLEAEALIFAASLFKTTPSARLFVAEPQPGPLWPTDPRISAQARDALVGMGAAILPLHNQYFGAHYPNGNKIEALALLPADEPFVFFDTDTLILSDLSDVPFDFDKPSASLRREDTWPSPRPDGPDRAKIWRSLYNRFDLDFASSLDRRYPAADWRRYLYFNAGMFFYRCPRVFGHRFLDYARAIERAPNPALAGQALHPWLDQIALPLVVHGLGGGRDTLQPGWIDGRTSCHYRTPPLLYAREADATVAAFEAIAARPDLAPLLRRHGAFSAVMDGGTGARIRALFDRAALPDDEATIRHRIKDAGLWHR